MKKIIVRYTLLILPAALMLFANSCKKEDDPYSKASSNPVANAVDPGQGPANMVLTVNGSNMGGVASIAFETDNVEASFNPLFNTDNTIIFRVPSDAVPGPQKIIFTNTKGVKFSVNFNVLGLPAITAVSNYNFSTGTQLTLTGKNLNDVTAVTYGTSADVVTIVSKTPTSLVISMPATVQPKGFLAITNLAGTSTTTQEFVSLQNNFIMFTDDWGPGAYNSGVQSWSWGSNAFASTDFAKSGTKSLRVDYVDGGLSMFLGSDWGAPAHNFTDFYTPFPTYLSFWARAVGSDVTVIAQPDGGAGTFNASGEKTITIPADTWTYFKIPANFITGQFSRLNIKISGSTNKTVYYDDVMWVK
jgi:hypothetical protein